MQNIKSKIVLICLGLLGFSGLSFADGPCPDGQFNPQSSVCICPGGGFVAPNTYCKAKQNGGKTYLKPMWGAIALDLPQGRESAFASSYDSQTVANNRAAEKCGYSSCRVYLNFKNSCGAVAVGARAGAGNVLGGGVAQYEADAERNALNKCAKNGGQNCVIWMKARCAGSPR